MRFASLVQIVEHVPSEEDCGNSYHRVTRPVRIDADKVFAVMVGPIENSVAIEATDHSRWLVVGSPACVEAALLEAAPAARA